MRYLGRTTLGQQFAGLLGPIAHIAAGEVTNPTKDIEERVASAKPVQSKERVKRKRRSSTTEASHSSTSDASWKHDPGKWGMPLQQWTTPSKAIWLLHVIAGTTERSEFTASEVASTFNKHFKQSGAIRPQNVARDLGTLKGKGGKDVPVAEHGGKWYLTTAGQARAGQLVSEARGEGT